MHHGNHDMQACIDACLTCYRTCHTMMMGHCVETGGAHVAPDHVRIMTACAEMCRASAHIMITGSPLHAHSCRACAEFCDACAADCERVGDMEDCVAACRRCAEECRKMAA
ncbi:four-helix bundle copper-binding protein [uncultured Paracoccus sp.]|uniref:four-helix bundle copper-binding protein n=1 Tax=uncultured Paracoccus sp. TaxID=189685 RepID=UPI0026290A0A|nr:four-helix bundle copper-binding protein [uncultured Paracoccus sp.]